VVEGRARLIQNAQEVWFTQRPQREGEARRGGAAAAVKAELSFTGQYLALLF
jgi:hypothetical protein